MKSLDEFSRQCEDELAQLAERGLLRRLRLPLGIDLVSNDYLGLATHPLLAERMAAAARELPAGAGGSRLLRGHHACFESIETRLALNCGFINRHI